MPRDGIEIGDGESLTRRKRATGGMTTIRTSPASEPISPAETPVRKRRAKSVATPMDALPGVSPIGQGESPDREREASIMATPRSMSPPSPPIGTVSDGDAGGDGQNSLDTQGIGAISATVSTLVSLQRRRQFSIVQVGRSERAIEALIASTMGFRIDATEKDRKAVFSRAKAFRLSVERGGDGQQQSDTLGWQAISALAPLVLISAENRKPWVELRKNVEKEMAKLTRSLPVHEFAKSVRGLGELGLACLVAEAGIPIGDYRTVSGLWKRMGLAVFDGRRQQKCRDKAEADRHGYSPRRRAEVWAFCSDSMFRAQWSGADEEAGLPARPNGAYGAVYARRRAITEPRIEATADLPSSDRDKWTKGRCHNDARRIMSKALLRDLWRGWRGMPAKAVQQYALDQLVAEAQEMGDYE